MNSYRIVVVDDTGKASRQRSFICGDDSDAIVWAKQLEGETPIELWSGARFVTRIEPQTRARAESASAVSSPACPVVDRRGSA